MNRLRHDLSGAVMTLFIGLSNGAYVCDEFTLSEFDALCLRIKAKGLEILHLDHIFKDGSAKNYI